jgi:MoaD family protein
MPEVRLLLFARAREAAGRRDDALDGPTLGDVLAVARERYGPEFAEVLAGARVWVNGDEPASGDATPLSDGDEVAILPPVSGGGEE